MTETTQVKCLVDARAQVGEGIIWDEQNQRIYWVDIAGYKIFETDPNDGSTNCWNIGQHVGFAALTNKDNMVVAARNGFFRFDMKTRMLEPIVNPEPDFPDNTFNDGCVDPKGRLWAGTMEMAPLRTKPKGSLYRLDSDGSCTKFCDGFYVTNGLAFSPDGKTMYVSDSESSVMRIWAYDYDCETGTPSNCRLFADLKEKGWAPDGATVDNEGGYWSAMVGSWKVARFNPDGSVDKLIDMPIQKPTKPLLVNGAMYVTSISTNLEPGTKTRQPLAGGVFKVNVGHDAPAHPRWIDLT
ncbi:MAG: SMP-30/gluconolactonase/LRE family protein [Rhodospirillales bacterium]|nr:SMP-30/gluconolactonase/LRE family protein [Rhodospirillales bacterium]